VSPDAHKESIRRAESFCTFGLFRDATVYGMHNDRTPNGVQWIGDAVEYVDSYALENTAQEPESEADREIEEILGRAIERIAGLQAIREYARLSKTMVKNDQLD
jgi:hypothetical protein